MTKKATNDAMIGELKSLAMISGGLILGSMGGKALDKALKVDDSLPGFQAKKLVKPAVQLGAGVLGAIKLKDKNMKLVAAGVGASGVMSTVKVVLKKDLLSGIAGLGDMGNAMSVYQDPVQLSVQRYNPDLPQLNAAQAEELSSDSIYGPELSAAEVETADFEII